MAMEEIRQMISNVNFQHMYPHITKTMCEIIVEGKESNYKFEGDPEDPTAHWIAKEESDNIVYFGDLERILLTKTGLFEESYKDGFEFRPTQKALQLYEKLKNENLLNKDGYLLENVAKVK